MDGRRLKGFGPRDESYLYISAIVPVARPKPPVTFLRKQAGERSNISKNFSLRAEHSYLTETGSRIVFSGFAWLL